ncbi:hypothetical protein AM391_RS02990 [Kluyvera ascorbata]|nr:hypothetical protein [Kluyvera ascorbata]
MTINLTDPANHPANGPLTAERVKRVIEALEISLKYSNGSSMDHVLADAVKGLEELLVSKVAASEPVSDDELDQMIWKLERDGMTPKLLSLMRELRERRKTDKPTNDERIMAIEGIAPPVTQIKPVADLYGITSPTGSETSFTFDAVEASGFAKGGWAVQEYVEIERYQEAIASGNSPKLPESWKEEAENLSEAYGSAFVIFRHGEEPVCADPTKFWFGFDPAAPKEVK